MALEARSPIPRTTPILWNTPPVDLVAAHQLRRLPHRLLRLLPRPRHNLIIQQRFASTAQLMYVTRLRAFMLIMTEYFDLRTPFMVTLRLLRRDPQHLITRRHLQIITLLC